MTEKAPERPARSVFPSMRRATSGLRAALSGLRVSATWLASSVESPGFMLSLDGSQDEEAWSRALLTGTKKTTAEIVTDFKRGRDREQNFQLLYKCYFARVLRFVASFSRGILSQELSMPRGRRPETMKRELRGDMIVAEQQGREVGRSVRPSSSRRSRGATQEPKVKAAQGLPPGDIVFMIDESGSMQEDIVEVRARVGHIVGQLGANVDFRLGLVGFGTRPPHKDTKSDGEAHIHSVLTADVQAFAKGLNEVVASGSTERGFSAVTLGMSNQMGFRPEAAVCGIMITDEDADDAELQTAALTALRNRNDAVFFGIVNPSDGNTRTQYGVPGPPDASPAGSLARETLGQAFNIVDFRRDAGPVLAALLQRCIVITTVQVTLEPATDTNPVGSNHTVTATVRVNNAPTAGVTVNFTVSEGPNSGTRGTATTDSNGRTSFTYTGRKDGTDLIQARVVHQGIDRLATATKVWDVPTVKCALAPETATSTIVKPHTVTAAVTQSGNPVTNVPVTFRTTSGPNAGTTSAATTNANGQARFTYTSVPTAGTDTIVATGAVDATPFECTATKVWKLPCEVSGIIRGETWTKECSPYLVVGDVQVESLKIGPAVTVLFQGNFLFEVTGTLTAIGTIEEPIIFTRGEGVTGWRGIMFNSSPPGSEMAYFIVERSSNSGIRLNNSSPTIRNGTLRENSVSGSGGGIFTNSPLTLSGCVISNNASRGGGGIFASASLTMKNCAVLGNTVTTTGVGRGGGIYAAGPLEMTNSVVTNNSISARSALGGGIYAISSVTLTNSIISNNSIFDTADGVGGGMYTTGTAALTNCIVSNNSVPSGQRNRGGGIAVGGGTLALTNCTVAYNGNVGLLRDSGDVRVINSILYFNTGAQVSGAATVTYSNVQGSFQGEGNINLNPLFASAGCEGLRIIVPSPCIDAGSPDASSMTLVARPPWAPSGMTWALMEVQRHVVGYCPHLARCRFSRDQAKQNLKEEERSHEDD